MAVIFYRLNILVLTQVLNHRIKRNCYSFIRGEKLQFIFRDINPRDSECVYTFMLRISEGGLYQSEYSKQNRTVTNGFGNYECYHEWLEMSHNHIFGPQLCLATHHWTAWLTWSRDSRRPTTSLPSLQMSGENFSLKNPNS